MKHEYKISICMMVKDEERHLKDCLGSLKPILENIKSELIIIDTGSKDNTVEIAKQYTDKLYFHEWNNNFSEMRNKTLSYGKGEWFFIVDGDEVLENPNEIIDLFNTHEILKEYNTIQLKVKNYFSLAEEDTPAVISQSRFYRNDGEFRYEGSVHNQPKYKGPIYNTRETYFKHYGYITYDKKLMEKKFKRTATILKKELEKDPDNIYYRHQLAVSYSMHKDHKESLEEIRKAYALLKVASLEEKKKFIYVYGIYGRIAGFNKEYMELIEVCQEGIKLRPDHVDLYYMIGSANLILHKKEEGIKYFKEYLKLMDKFHDLEISKDDTIILYNNNEKCKSSANTVIAKYYMDKDEYEKAYEYSKLITDENKRIIFEVEILTGFKKYNELLQYYGEIKDNKNHREIFINLLETKKKSLNEEERNKLVELFSQGEDSYAIFNKIKISDEESKHKLINGFLNQIDLNNIQEVYIDIFKEVIKSKKLRSTILKKMKNLKIKQYISCFINKFEEEKEYMIDYLITEKIRSNDYQSLRVYVSIANSILLESIEHSKKFKEKLTQEYDEIFKFYIESGIKYIKNLYQLDKMRLMYKTMDNTEEQFFILIHFAKDELEKNNIKRAIEYFKEAVQVYPYMAILFNRYKDGVFDEIE